MRRYLFVTMVVVMVATSIALGRGQSPGGAPTRAWRFEQIGKGVHFATGTGVMTTMSNSHGHRQRRSPMLVDTSVTPAAARALVAQIKEELTPKPIKYVFNSHYHFDHAHGNQIFGDDVEIVGHEYIRQMHLSNVLQQRTNRSFTEVLPNQIAQMKQRIAQDHRREGAGAARGQPARHRGALEGGPGGRAQAAERDLHRRDDPSQGRPRSAAALPRARPHRRRHDGVPARRADRLHRRLLRGTTGRRRSVVPRRRVHRRMAGQPRTPQGARLRHHRARATARRSTSASRSPTSRTTCATCGARRQRCACRASRRQQATEKIDMSKFAAQYGLTSSPGRSARRAARLRDCCRFRCRCSRTRN